MRVCCVTVMVIVVLTRLFVPTTFVPHVPTTMIATSLEIAIFARPGLALNAPSRMPPRVVVTRAILQHKDARRPGLGRSNNAMHVYPTPNVPAGSDALR